MRISSRDQLVEQTYPGPTPHQIERLTRLTAKPANEPTPSAILHERLTPGYPVKAHLLDCIRSHSIDEDARLESQN